MSGTIWDKGGASVPEELMNFLAGDDRNDDRILLRFDVEASVAHVRGLARIGVLTAEGAETLATALAGIAVRFERGELGLEGHEDGHSAIEAWLTAELGELGKRVHTGRSRNDQVQVALRLYMKDVLGRLVRGCKASAAAFLERAEAFADVPMPGYTHLQRAMPSSVGFWLAGFAEAFVDDAALAKSAIGAIDASPLGTAAGFGVPIALDRAGVARELGFARVQENGGYVQNSRGKFERIALSALSAALLDVRRFAWDLSLFTTSEFAFVRLPDTWTTGSSLMPNKRNPDVVELLRAAASPVLGAETEIAHTLSLPSGYHRDLQATKGPFVRAAEHGLRALALIPALVEAVAIEPVAMRAAIDPSLFATERATELALEGVPFRDAYRQVAGDLEGSGSTRTPEQSLIARVSPGAHADLGLARIRARLEEC